MADSHIQLPKCVLKQFHDDKGKLFFYDFVDNSIKRAPARSVNTAKDYYSSVIEEYLNKAFETDLGRFIKDAREYLDDGENELSIKPGFLSTIKMYVHACIYRGESFQDSVASTSKHAHLLNSQQRHDLTVYLGLENIDESLFDDLVAVFGINMTEEPFVLPLTGSYELHCFEQEALCVPISPFVTVIYTNTIATRRMLNISDTSKEPYLIRMRQKSMIRALNQRAFITEKELNGRMVISNERRVLEDLLEYAQ